MTLASCIRTIPDYPEKGILFRDITTLLNDPVAFRTAIDRLTEHCRKAKPDRIAAIDSRGFILGAPLAYQLGTGLVIIRKQGKLPAATISESYDMEYGTNTIEIHTDAISPNERILLVDDLIATGGTAEAAVRLIRKCGGNIVECAFLIDLPELGGSKRLEQAGCPVFSLCSFEGK